MTNKESADILTRHNAWLRDNEIELPTLSDSPVQIGEAIDTALEALRDLEKAKKLFLDILDLDILLQDITETNDTGQLILKIYKFLEKLE